MRQTTGMDGLLLLLLQLLNIDGLLYLFPAADRGFDKSLTCPEFPDNTRLLKFPLEFLQSPVYVLAFFYRYNDHIELCVKIEVQN